MNASRLGLGALTGATAWARVEANQHYPSDVLAGIAIGHFFGVFLLMRSSAWTIHEILSSRSNRREKAQEQQYGLIIRCRSLRTLIVAPASESQQLFACWSGCLSSIRGLSMS